VQLEEIFLINLSSENLKQVINPATFAFYIYLSLYCLKKKEKEKEI